MHLKSERMLNMLSVSAVNFGVSSVSAGDCLRPCDVAAALGCIDPRGRLIIEAKIGLIGSAGIAELLILIRSRLCEFDWFDVAQMQSALFRRKLDSCSQCAIASLVGGLELKTVRKAECLGMSVSCFNKTWATRVDDVYRLISGWLIDGDNALFNVLSGGLRTA